MLQKIRQVFNSFMTEAVIIYKPVHWFALQINVYQLHCIKNEVFH